MIETPAEAALHLVRHEGMQPREAADRFGLPLCVLQVECARQGHRLVTLGAYQARCILCGHTAPAAKEGAQR
jgi:hypothetical protein